MGAERCARFTRLVEAHHAVIAERHGFDPFYGRRLAGDLGDAGLVDADFRGRASMWRAGEPGGEIWRLSLEQLRDGIVDLGLMDAGEADAAIALCTDPDFSSLSPVMMYWEPDATAHSRIRSSSGSSVTSVISCVGSTISA